MRWVNKTENCAKANIMKYFKDHDERNLLQNFTSLFVQYHGIFR